ncbi:hypothetical protein F4703DRAFT_1874336 [Phycomyces blakesleeanus]
MTSPWSTFPLSLKRTLTVKTKRATLGLYRSLLRTAQHFDNDIHQVFLWNTIRERFRFEMYNSSRAQTLTLLLQGEKALDLLRKAQGGNRTYLERIDAMATAKIGPLKHVTQNIRKIQHPLKRALAATDARSHASRIRQTGRSNRIPLSKSLCRKLRIDTDLPLTRRQRLEYKTRIYKKKKKLRVRTFYQQAITTRNSCGYVFKRVRGWVQPLRTSMMLKNLVKKKQQRFDLNYKYAWHLELVRQERIFLSNLGIKDELGDCSKFHNIEMIKKYC